MEDNQVKTRAWAYANEARLRSEYADIETTNWLRRNPTAEPNQVSAYWNNVKGEMCMDDLLNALEDCGAYTFTR